MFNLDNGWLKHQPFAKKNNTFNLRKRNRLNSNIWSGSIRVFIQDNQGLPTGQGSETYGPKGFCMFAKRPKLVVFQPIGLFSVFFSKHADQKLSKWHETAVRV